MSLFQEVKLETYMSFSGKLEVANFFTSDNFSAKRFYLIRDVREGEIRGLHAHKELNQIFFCVQGQFQIELNDGKVKQSIVLKESGTGIIIYAGLWRELSEFSQNAICLVLAADEYNSMDYIYDYKEFIAWKEKNGSTLL